MVPTPIANLALDVHSDGRVSPITSNQEFSMRKGFTLIELMIVIAIIAIIAAIAIPNLLESRISSNEAAAGSSLKSGLHPAQVQFQGGNYSDNNSNGIGDFADNLSWMAGATGAVPLPQLSLSLLPSPWATSDCTTVGTGVNINNYNFQTAAQFEYGFGAMAAPSDGLASIGRRRFGINTAGTIYSTTPAAVNPMSTLSGTVFVGPNYTNFGTGWSVYKR